VIATITKVEVQNLSYVAGAIVLIVILAIFVTLRHRKPKSVESNMASFNKGLRALAPDAEVPRRRSRPSPVRPTPAPPALRSTVTIRPAIKVVPADDQAGPDAASAPPPDGEAGAETQGSAIAADDPTSLEAETG
jgi:hypothetical protein